MLSHARNSLASGSEDKAVASKSDWVVLAVASASKAIAYTVVALLLWAFVPSLLGLTVTTVASGSMEPRIMTGDVVAAMPVAPETLRAEQVILFHDPSMPERLKLHRIIDVSTAGLETQGDANPTPDSMLVTPEAVVGIGALRVPYIGTPINWLHHGEFLKLGALAIALVLVASGSNLDAELRARDRGKEANGVAVVAPKLKRRYPKLVGYGVPLTASLLVAAAVLYMFSGPSSSAAFSSHTVAKATFQAASSFVKPWANAQFHWGFAETSPNLGIAQDDVYSQHPGTLAGGVTRATENGNPYVTLNGSTGQIYTGKMAGSAPNNFSLETWFKTTTTRGGKLIGYGDSQSGPSNVYDRHLYMTDAGKLVYGIYQDGAVRTITSTNSYNDGRWHMVTVSMSDTAGSALYVDGVRVASSYEMTRGQSIAANGYWRVGYDSISGTWPSSPTSKFFAGSLDNTSLYPFPLSPAVVADHYRYGR